MPYAKKPPAALRASAEAASVIRFEPEPYHFAIPDRTLLADLLKVAHRLGVRSLFQQQYRKHGRFSTQVFNQRFGTWNGALQAVGLEPCHSRLVDDSAILADIQRVAQQLGIAKLQRSDYFIHGRYGTTTIARRFGSWSRAVSAAGLIPYPVVQRNPTQQELLDNFETVWRTVGRQPRGHEFAPPVSRFSLRTYKQRFGTFRKALMFFIAHQKKLGNGDPRQPVGPMPICHKTRRDIRTLMRYQVLRRDHFKCRLCGRSPAVDPAVQLQVDHVKPWSAGGETVLENLQTLCDTCNVGKSNS